MRKLGVWFIVFLVGFLLGFVPQYLKAHSLRDQLTSCTAKADLAGVQQSAALTYVAATQLNYGVASGYAQQFFAQAQTLQNSTSDSGVRSVLSEALSARDKITADLATGKAEVVAELQPLITKLEQAGH